jgi:dTDP-4-amino-4,6-dideoxygalactose transaminase
MSLNNKNSLAVNGGTPVFENNDDGKFLHPINTVEIENAVLKLLRNGMSLDDCTYTIKSFESEFASYHNKKYGLATSSGTAALWSMYDGVGLKQGDEIICPSYTFSATNTPVFFTGATPILVDCDEYGSVDPVDVEAKITSRTKAIVVTHVWGYACEMDKLRAIADKHNLFLLEDASHAHGGSYKEKKLGEWGDAAVFSLESKKIITAGEGGILITNNREIYERAIFLGHFFMRAQNEIGEESDIYKFRSTGKGMKLCIHPLAAAIAYEQLHMLDEFNAQKQKYAKLLISGLEKIDCLSVLTPRKDSINSWYRIVMLYDGAKLNGISRKTFVDALKAEGAIETSYRGYEPINNYELFQHPHDVFPGYQNEPMCSVNEFPKTRSFSNSCIRLPVWYTDDSKIIVEKYIEAFKKVCDHADELL